MSNTRKSRLENFDWTPELLRAWASEHRKTRYLPQDFALVIAGTATIEEARFFLEMATDLNCRKRAFFVDCLYVFVADLVRGKGGFKNYRKISQSDIEHFLLRGEKFPIPSIQQWVGDSRQLLENPPGIDYNDWFMGRLSRHALQLDEPLKTTKTRRPSKRRH